MSGNMLMMTGTTGKDDRRMNLKEETCRTGS
jgi:hypothetical protein